MSWEGFDDRASSSIPLLQDPETLEDLDLDLELDLDVELDHPSLKGLKGQRKRGQGRGRRRRQPSRTMSKARTGSVDSTNLSPISHKSPEDHDNVRDVHGLDHKHPHTDSESDGEVILVEAREDLGADKAEASAKVWGKYSRWFLYVSLGLAAYVYSLDQTTTYFYTAFATSSFSHHSLLSSIEVASQVIRESLSFRLRLLLFRLLAHVL